MRSLDAPQEPISGGVGVDGLSHEEQQEVALEGVGDTTWSDEDRKDIGGDGGEEPGPAFRRTI